MPLDGGTAEKFTVQFSEAVGGSAPGRQAFPRISLIFAVLEATGLGTEIALEIRRLPMYGLTLM